MFRRRAINLIILSLFILQSLIVLTHYHNLESGHHEPFQKTEASEDHDQSDENDCGKCELLFSLSGTDVTEAGSQLSTPDLVISLSKVIYQDSFHIVDQIGRYFGLSPPYA